MNKISLFEVDSSRCSIVVSIPAYHAGDPGSLIQETMSTAWKACHVFLKIFPGWEVSVMDALGHSGGLLCCWNPSSRDFRSYSTSAGILLTGCVRHIDEELMILNIYGPYRDRELLWNQIVDGSILRAPNLILGGDLNFTLSPNELWGTRHGDPLSGYFNNVIRDLGLIDVCPIQSSPTWRNRRMAEQGTAKRLDRFLISGTLTLKLDRYRVWHESYAISDHFPACFQLGL